MNILFTCAGRRKYLLKYFREALNGQGKIIATDMHLSAPALAEADYIEIVPAVYAENYIFHIKEICKKHNVIAIISLNDLELPILSKHKNEFSEIGVNVIISDSKVIDTCFDKYKTYNFIKSIGLNSPLTYKTIDDAKQSILKGILKFPIIIKPRWGSGSIGIEIAHDIEELDLLYTLVNKKLNRSILANASQSDEAVIIQEFIDGREYGVDIMNDLHGNNRGVSVKQKLSMRAGETDKAITIQNCDIYSIGTQIANHLQHIGNLDCDILERNGTYYILELNPRFGGGYPFSHEAGVNMPKAIITWLQGQECNNNLFIPEYNKMFAKCDILVNVSN